MGNEIFVTLQTVGYFPPRRADLFTDTVSDGSPEPCGAIVRAYEDKCMGNTFRNLVDCLKDPKRDNLNDELIGNELLVANYLTELLEKEKGSQGTFALSYMPVNSQNLRGVSLDNRLSEYSSDIIHEVPGANSKPTRQIYLTVSESLTGGLRYQNHA